MRIASVIASVRSYVSPDFKRHGSRVSIGPDSHKPPHNPQQKLRIPISVVASLVFFPCPTDTLADFHIANSAGDRSQGAIATHRRVFAARCRFHRRHIRTEDIRLDGRPCLSIRASAGPPVRNGNNGLSVQQRRASVKNHSRQRKLPMLIKFDSFSRDRW